MPMSTKCQKNEKKRQLMSYNMMIGYDIYDRFTMEHFPLRQRMTLLFLATVPTYDVALITLTSEEKFCQNSSKQSCVRY
jgi:hypothetical protein